MNGNPLQLTLREMQLHFSNPKVAAALLVVGALLGIAGPFGTFEVLEQLPRLAYWIAITVATYGVGLLVALLAVNAFGMRFTAIWARVLVFGVIIGVPVTLVVLLINVITFGAGWAAAIDPLTLWFDSTLVGMGVMTVSEILGGTLRRRAGALPQQPGIPEAATEPPTAAADLPERPPILDRVPLPQRGRLWALVVEDHYVELVTDRGKTLVLIRLSDAIRETGNVAGLQIHRSHWVALDAIKRVVRVDGKAMVELPDGRRLGISRGYLPAAREAGLI